MEVIAEIRRRHLVSGENISSITRDLKLSRPMVRKHLQTGSEAVYVRQHQREVENIPAIVAGGHHANCGADSRLAGFWHKKAEGLPSAFCYGQPEK